MKETNPYLESIHEIRSIMERSSKFLSLSGLSGIAAGLTAIVSGVIAYFYLGSTWNSERISVTDLSAAPQRQILFLSLLAAATLLIAVTFAFLFTYRNAKKKHLPIWDKPARLLTINILIPLITGGLFILALVFRFGMYELAAPSMLIFYGLGLVNASKYSVNHTWWLGVAEITVGLAALLYPAYGLLFWIIGFGILHLIYGTILYYSFERNL